VRTYKLVPHPLKTAVNWIETQRKTWEHRLDQLDRYLADLKEEKR
jgi:hypothetical protein